MTPWMGIKERAFKSYNDNGSRMFLFESWGPITGSMCLVKGTYWYDGETKDSLDTNPLNLMEYIGIFQF